MTEVSIKNLNNNEIISGELSKGEMLGHAIGGIGQNFIFALWSGYIMMFYTDVFGLSATFVGILFFGARVWDAINDPIMGIMADKTRTKWGRFRPWLLFMPIPIGICLVLNFTVPNFSGSWSIFYVIVTYILMSMAFTAIDIPYWSMPSAMTIDPIKRTKLFSYARLSTSLASVVAGMIIIPLVNLIGKGDMKKGFFGTAIIISIIGAIFYLISFKMTREHITASTEKFNYKKAIQALTQNKPLMIILISSIAINLGMILKNSLQLYYVQYNLGTLNLVPVFSFLSLPGIVFGSLMAPKISGKYGKKNTLIGSNIALLISGIIFMFTPYTQVWMIILMTAIQVTVIGLAMVVVSSMIADTIEYAEWKTGQRNEGIISSTQTFTTKVAIAISGLLSGIILTLSGYVPNVEQSQSTLIIFHVVSSIVPGLIGILSCIPLKWYDLTEDKHLKIIEDIKNRKNK